MNNKVSIFANDVNAPVKVELHESGEYFVSAKELYNFLGYDKSNWVKWYNKNIIQNPFAIENSDWVWFVLSTNHNETKDFAITINFAKRLSMMARTEKGEIIRDYFIACKDRLKNVQKFVVKDLQVFW